TGNYVVVVDDFNDFYDPQIKHANTAAFAKDVAIYQVDLRDSVGVRKLFHSEKIDAIAHLAARAGVRPSIEQPRLYYDTNVTGTLHLVEAAQIGRASCRERVYIAERARRVIERKGS